jgi:uncharacterized membrane protein HdeD (DUF308 family)
MRAQKLLLTIVTGLFTVFSLLISILFYFLDSNASRAIATLFFLGCAGIFSIYFHIKTKELYPFADFDEPLEEISKKYWGMHIAFGSIMFVMGIALTYLLFVSETGNYYIIGLCVFAFGLWSLLDVYFLNKFIVSYKKRLERQEEIDDIGDNSTL